MPTHPKNLEGSITILGENGTIKVGGVAVNEIPHWEFVGERDYDSTIDGANYLTDSVYGFGHPPCYDNVFCGPSMVFTNVYNPRSHAPEENEYRDTVVRRGATLGAHSTIVWGGTIGEYAFVAAGAVINRSVPAYAFMAGVPARQVG